MCRQSLFWARGLIVATEVCVITAEGILECGEEDREGRMQCRDKSFLGKIRTRSCQVVLEGSVYSVSQ